MTANNSKISSSLAFQQVKQTQASLARLSRAHQHQQQQQHLANQANQSSHHIQPASTVCQEVTSIKSSVNKYTDLALKKQGASETTSTTTVATKGNIFTATNSSGQQQQNATTPTLPTTATTKSTTFVDCLIRRFKDCFSEDFCTVPMFVVGNLSPGSDGTHLILPPCVSLGRQNISRFASPKNLKLMNSIRESCKSIEELDLGGNKLTDLIEVYKILQCTPNIRFLNLSENDLSRTSPVAMASSCSSSSSTSASASSSSITSAPVASTPALTASNWSTSNSVGLNQRACLAPINQNQQHTIGSRRHSTLGQVLVTSSTNSSTLTDQRSTRQPISRVAEARRLAAAAAVAQTRKTSSSVASKLAHSASANGSLARQAGSSARPTTATGNGRSPGHHRQTTRGSLTSSQRHHQVGAATSTMHLARSLSSLSAKDVRAASSSLKRLSAHRSTGARAQVESTLRSSTAAHISREVSTGGQNPPVVHHHPISDHQLEKQKEDATSKCKPAIGSQQSKPPLFVEPIAETDDVDMGEQQQVSQPSTNTTTTTITTGTTSSNNNNESVTTAATTTTNTGSNSNTSSSLVSRGAFSSSHVAVNQSTPASNQSSPNYRRTFESIKALALNNTGCQWRVVCSILSRMPNLEELHLSLNNYERIDLEPNEFKHHSLKRLYLCNNPKLTNWEELDKLLIAFPSLEALSIADCSISQIPDNLDRAREWRKLCGLNINGWPIKEWPVIERLNQLPSLIDLKCRNLDILNTIDEPRHHLIARLPKLQRLNGSEIEEREHAEKAFLRFFMTNSHLERPPRFHELVQIHGEVIPVDVDVDLSPPSHAQVRVVYLNRNHYRNEEDTLMSEDFLIKLMDNVDPNVVQNNSNSLTENMEVGDVTSNANDNEAEGDNKLVRLFKDEAQEVLAIEVDLRQSVRKFKSTLASLFSLSSQNIILYYIDHEMVGLMGPELIKHNQKKLWNYNVQDGDQFIVEER